MNQTNTFLSLHDGQKKLFNTCNQYDSLHVLYVLVIIDYYLHDIVM